MNKSSDVNKTTSTSISTSTRDQRSSTRTMDKAKKNKHRNKRKHLKTGQKRSRADSYAFSAPSTFVSSDFRIRTAETSKAGSSSMQQHKENKENKNSKLNPERDLWNQVLNIRQVVSLLVQDTLNHPLHSDGMPIDDASQALNSNFDLSKDFSKEFSQKMDSSYSSEDDDDYDDDDESSWDSADAIINLEGILVHVSTSDSSSFSEEQKQLLQQQDDASAGATSCVSSLGLGGHETTTPIHFSPSHYSKSLARGNRVSPLYSAPTTATTTPSRGLQRQDSDAKSLVSEESFTAWEAFGHSLRILYFFLLEFPIHFYSFLTEHGILPKTTSKTRLSDSKKRDKRRFFLYLMLALFIIGCVVAKQCPSCIPTMPRTRSTSPRLSQSCVTPATTANTTFDLAPPLLSVTVQSKSKSNSSTISPPSRATIEVLDTSLDDAEEILIHDIDNSFTFVEESLHQEEEEEIITRPKTKLVHQLQTQGKILVQKLAKNNHKMWGQFPTPVSTSEPEQDVTKQSSPPPLKKLQEKGQEVLRKLVKNNANMWDNYPMGIQLKKKQDATSRSFDFLKKTANMWGDKRSDYHLKG